MELIVFDIRGTFAHFRAYDTTRENITYPFPPRTAILGLIAGMMGKERNSYWGDHPLNNSSISIQLLSPIYRTKIRVNYVQTRNPMIIHKKLKIILPKDPFEVKSKDQRGYHSQVNLNVLRDVAYRIYFSNEDNEIFEELEWRLKEKRYCYPPYLGHANMLAEVNYVATIEAKPMSGGIYHVDTIFPVNSVDNKNFNFDDFGYTVLFNVPYELGFDNGQLYLKKAIHLVVNPATETEKLKAYFKENKVYNARVQGKDYNIVFLE